MTASERREASGASKAGKGFPAGVRFTPVPNPLLAGLLEEIDDLGELKLTLRLVWALNRKRGFPKFISAGELCSDRTVGMMLGAAGEELERAVDTKLAQAVERGTLLKVSGASPPAAPMPIEGIVEGLEGSVHGEGRRHTLVTGTLPRRQVPFYCLNTEENRRAVERGGFPTGEGPGEGASETWPGPGAGVPDAGAFSAYEQNIGPLTPVVVGRIERALLDHSEEDVVEAIRTAVDANARSWNYISAVLRARGDLERRPSSAAGGPGRRQSGQRGSDGKPGRDSAQGLTDEFIRKYVERQRERSQSGPPAGSGRRPPAGPGAPAQAGPGGPPQP